MQQKLEEEGEAAFVILLVYSLYRSINVFERKPITWSIAWQFALSNFNLTCPWIRVHIQQFVRCHLNTISRNHARIGFGKRVGSNAQECQKHNIWCLRVQENHESKSSHGRNVFGQTFRKLGQELNPGPLDLKSTALPTDPWREEIPVPKV